jgi:hypothetical protein
MAMAMSMATTKSPNKLKYTLCTVYDNGVVRIRLDINEFGTYTYFQTYYNIDNDVPYDSIFIDCNKRGLKFDYTLGNNCFLFGDIYVVIINNNDQQLNDSRCLDIYDEHYSNNNNFIYNKLSDDMHNFIINFIPYIKQLYLPYIKQ